MPHVLIVALATFVTKQVVSTIDEHINKGKTPKKACNSYSWDPVSAGRKLGSGTTVTVSGKVKGVDLTAICDVSGSLPDKIEGESQFTDVDEMINSGLIDAIHICTPHPSHKEIGIKSLEANLHVLMEKPLAVDKADCEA